MTLPVLGFAVLPPFLKQGFRDHDIGPLTDYLPEGQWLVVTFMTDPTAGPVSRLTAFVRYNGFLGDLPSFTCSRTTARISAAPSRRPRR